MGKACHVEWLESRQMLSGGVVVIGGGAPVYHRGHVFNDINADGVRQSNEPALGNWPITLAYRPFASSGPPLFKTYRTVSDGAYKIQELDLNYMVDSYSAATTGWRQSNVTKFRFGENFDFAVTQRALASGRVFNDSNANGAVDATDLPIAGRTVYVDVNRNGLLDAGVDLATTTDSKGRWAFTNLPATSHSIRLLTDSATTPQSIPSNNAAIALKLGAGAEATHLSFASRGATVSGTLFNDLDGDGTHDVDAGEPGMGDWRIYADLDGDSTRDASEPEVRTAFDGSWFITGLPGGTFTIRSETRDAFPKTAGADGYRVKVKADQTVAALVFGKRGAIIKGTVFDDINNNGVRDFGEGPDRSRIVYLDTNDNGRRDTGEKWRDGYMGTYAFTDIGAGSYAVRVVEDEFRVVTAPAKRVYRTTVAPGDVRSHRDFALQGRATIYPVVFNDINGDGVLTAEMVRIGSSDIFTYEKALGDWTVYIDANDNGLFDAGEPSCVTSADRFAYEGIDGLRPGTYKVRTVSRDGLSGSAVTVQTQQLGSERLNIAVRA